MVEQNVKVGDLAKAIGKKGPWATQFLNGRRNIPVKTLELVARHFGREAWELMTPDVGVARQTTIPGFSSLPILPRAVGAGQPIVVDDDDEATEFIAFKDDFTRRFTKPVALRVGRDQQSMMPTIHPGDLVVIDRNEQSRLRPNPRLIYALNIDGGGTLKRIEPVEGQLIVSSDSPDKDKYFTFTRPVTGIDLRSVVVGEVVWIGRYIGSGKKR